MFSGIVEEKARVKKVTLASRGRVLTIESDIVSRDSRVGDSISVNGTCLTIVLLQGRNITFDVMEETLRGTNLSNILTGEEVNVERSLKTGDRISGHYVTGHIDCVGRIRAVKKRLNDYEMDIEFPEDKTDYVVEKGSIAIDGISLTVAKVKNNHITIYLIPLTLKSTNLGSKKPGDSVNIEFDILGKYALENAPSGKRGIDADFLKEHGFA